MNVKLSSSQRTALFNLRLNQSMSSFRLRSSRQAVTAWSMFDHELSAEQALALLAQSHQLLDVRSPAEFEKGHLPQSQLGSILNDQERHLVGLEYKTRGQQAAIDLGLALTSETRLSRTQHWLSLFQASDKIMVCCWRGGLRSETACQWMASVAESDSQSHSLFRPMSTTPKPIYRVRGGYKAMRGILLEQIQTGFNALVITGLTGCGKTDLLHFFDPHCSIDLESIACHRGSAFGQMKKKQPSQQTFENTLGLEIMTKRTDVYSLLLEDESRTIGHCVLPDPVFKILKSSQRILIDATLEQRSELIFHQYLEQVDDATQLQERFLGSLLRIRPKLGAKRYADLRDQIQKAFDSGERECHYEWIQGLLRDYYDLSYKKHLDQIKDLIQFAGPIDDVKAYLTDYFSRSRSR